MKSMLLTASDQQSFFNVSSKWDSKVEATELIAHPEESAEKLGRGVCTVNPNRVHSCYCNCMKVTILLLERITEELYHKSPGMPHE